jgi:hypothetical protein
MKKYTEFRDNGDGTTTFFNPIEVEPPLIVPELDQDELDEIEESWESLEGALASIDELEVVDN